MKLLSLAFSMLLVVPIAFAQETPVAGEEALDEFEQLTVQMGEYQRAFERGEVATPLKVQQYDTAAKEVRPEEHLLEYKSAITDPFYGYQVFILVNKSKSEGPSKDRQLKRLQPQTMYIFTRLGNEILLRYAVPVSTGKELTPGVSDTREGFVRIQNAQAQYVSRKYGEAMPFSLWFESEYGTAIHQTLQERCDSKIGSRASAGCIRLCPGDAEKVFRFVTQPVHQYMAAKNYSSGAPFVLLDKRSGVPIARGSDAALRKSLVDPDAVHGLPKVVRGFPVLVRIIDGNKPEKVQEMQGLLDNPTEAFHQYFRPVSAQALQGLSM